MAKSKKRTSKGAIITVAVVILAAIFTVIAAIGSLGFTKKDVKTWFNNWGKPTESTPQEEETITNGSGVIDNNGKLLNDPSAIYEIPESLTFYSSVPERAVEETSSTPLAMPTAATDNTARTPISSVTLTCTTNYELNKISLYWWVVSENNTTFDSTSQGDDYISIEVFGDANENVTINCYQISSKPYTLKVRVVNAQEITAECKIDFLRQFDNFNVQAAAGITDRDNSVRNGFNEMYLFVGSLSSVGTVYGTVSANNVRVNLTEEFCYDFRAMLKFDVDFETYVIEANISCSETVDVSKRMTLAFADFDFHNLISNYSTFDEAHKIAIDYAWRQVVNSYQSGVIKSGNFSVTADYEYVYNGKVYNRYENIVNFNTDACLKVWGQLPAVDLSLTNQTVVS